MSDVAIACVGEMLGELALERLRCPKNYQDYEARSVGDFVRSGNGLQQSDLAFDGIDSWTSCALAAQSEQPSKSGSTGLSTVFEILTAHTNSTRSILRMPLGYLLSVLSSASEAFLKLEAYRYFLATGSRLAQIG